jgi:ribose transport system ATP-binding protein
MRGVGKSFGQVNVLRNVDLDLHAGEVLVLLGENGAGKSTLIKMIAGIHEPSAGTIRLDGEPVRLRNVHDAEARGIITIHQELNVVPQLSVAENVLLGHLPNNHGFLESRRMRHIAEQAITRVGLSIDVNTPVGELGVAQQQLVEIAKALNSQARILILDEPTAALTGAEIDTLFAIMEELRSQGVAMVFISHHLEEVPRIGNRVMVLRDGDYIDTVPADTAEHELVRLMVGREITDHYPRRREYTGEAATLLEVENLSQGKRLTNISLEVRAGEVVGLAGLVGAGRTELIRAIAGDDHYSSGVVKVAGEPVAKDRVDVAIRHGVGHVPEDRKNQGLILQASVGENIGYATMRSTARFGFVDTAGQRRRTTEIADRLTVRRAGMDEPVMNLSGGNQQKCVFARWALAGSNVLLLDEPTRGVDVGARVELYEFINQVTARGGAVLMASSDLPEVLGMSDRILVMNQGRIVGELGHDEATQDRVMTLAATDAAELGEMK